MTPGMHQVMAVASLVGRCWGRREPKCIRRHGLRGEDLLATLSEKKRDSLKSSQFGLPAEKKYPMPDKSHARNAKARASQQEEKGNLSASDKKKIDAKADRILDE